MGKCPHKSPSPCNPYVIPCHYTNLCPHISQKHTHTSVTAYQIPILYTVNDIYIFFNHNLHIFRNCIEAISHLKPSVTEILTWLRSIVGLLKKKTPKSIQVEMFVFGYMAN